MKKISILVAAVLFVLLTLYVASMSGDHAGHDMAGGDHAGHAAAITSERAFLEHMIPHHEEAVITSSLVLERGATLRPLTELATAIVSSQDKEIDQMKEWYQTWYEVPYEDTGVYAPMMRPLEGLYGAELDRVFLEDMILHHEGAIVAAEAVLKLSISKEIEALAKGIISAQETEINLMRELIGLLPK